MQEKRKKEQSKINKVISFISWFVSILVSLSVGAGMATRTLSLEILFIPTIITVITGWIVILGTILSIILKFFE